MFAFICLQIVESISTRTLQGLTKRPRVKIPPPLTWASRTPVVATGRRISSSLNCGLLSPLSLSVCLYNLSACFSSFFEITSSASPADVVDLDKKYTSRRGSDLLLDHAMLCSLRVDGDEKPTTIDKRMYIQWARRVLLNQDPERITKLVDENVHYLALRVRYHTSVSDPAVVTLQVISVHFFVERNHARYPAGPHGSSCGLRVECEL